MSRKTPWWETHLYTYAISCIGNIGVSPENKAKMRAKAIKYGHTEGECLCVEKNPMIYARTGKFA
jgi:hypothetical protein